MESIPNYVIVNWGSISDVHLEQLRVTQKWVLKIILSKLTTYLVDLSVLRN